MQFDTRATNGVRSRALCPISTHDCPMAGHVKKEITMSKEEDNKAIVGRWFNDFWGKTCNLDIVDETRSTRHAVAIFAA